MTETKEERFACKQCDYRSVDRSNYTRHLKKHLKVHGTVKPLACDHPGCTFRTKWHGNIAQHKRQVHSDERLFACDHTGCSFQAKVRNNLSNHKKSVHLNIRDERCHVCENGFYTKTHLRIHMAKHEGDGHDVNKCKDCSVNLISKASSKTIPAAGSYFPCHHHGGDFKTRWKASLWTHLNQFRNQNRLFSCSHTGCSFRCKTKGNMTRHQNGVHLKIRRKQCHVCNMRFHQKADLRAHMKSRHETNDHSMVTCDDCITSLSHVQAASHIRRAEKGRMHSTPAIKLDLKQSKAGGRQENAFAFKEEQVQSQSHSLNDDLIEMHMEMQLLSSL